MGKAIDIRREVDPRFGHIRYNPSNGQGVLGVYPAECFIEKPNQEKCGQLRSSEGYWAWECGLVVAKRSYLCALLHRNPGVSIAGDVLTAVGNSNKNVQMEVSLMDAGIMFQDFGAPGEWCFDFWKGSYYDRGDQNICVGPNQQIQLTECRHNLIFSDRYSLMLKGLEGYLIIDSYYTQTFLAIPIEECGELDEYYRLFHNYSKKNFEICRTFRNPLKTVKTDEALGLVIIQNGLSIQINEKSEIQITRS